MKRFTTLILILLALFSCKREFDVTPADGDSVPVVNAIFDAKDTVHRVGVYLAQGQKVEDASAEDLTLKLNGAVIRSGTAVAGSVNEIDARFTSGDRLTIEATVNGIAIRGEAVVPEAPNVTLTDTLFVTDTLDGDKLRCYFTVNDKRGEQNYYRIEATEEYSADHYNRYSSEAFHHFYNRFSVEVNTSNDPIISSGYSTGHLDILSSVVSENTWSVFSDEAFDGKAVTLQVDIPVSEVLSSMKELINREDYDGFREWGNVQGAILLRVYSISKDQYDYLKAVTQIAFYGGEFSFLVEPTPLPVNVSGGLGHIAVDMPAVIRIPVSAG